MLKKIKDYFIVTKPEYVPDELENMLNMDFLYFIGTIILSIVTLFVFNDYKIMLFGFAIAIILFFVYTNHKNIIYNQRYYLIQGVCSLVERKISTRSSYVYITTIPENQVYRILIPEIKLKYRTGTYVDIYVSHKSTLINRNGVTEIIAPLHYYVIKGKVHPVE